MKSKLRVAYESESSTTTRITPKEIGELMGKMSLEQLKNCIDAYVTYSDMYHTRLDRYEKARYIIKQLEK